MKLLPFILLPLACGCAPRFEIVDQAGLPMFEVQRGTCFVGCNLRVKKSDGTKCSGFAVSIENGKALAAQIRCPEDPNPRDLRTEPLNKDGVTAGRLSPPKSLSERNRQASVANLAHANSYTQKN